MKLNNKPVEVQLATTAIFAVCGCYRVGRKPGKTWWASPHVAVEPDTHAINVIVRRNRFNFVTGTAHLWFGWVIAAQTKVAENSNEL
ncbi:hypothetical protein BDV25DRAFT_165163 [Aspergillus avenaceus]|uniref:Uncharacterized protein n=1 Tax=Aspergillus avenaceus TaxID=36643 RepID=A0A5N6TFQ9_ASPAV|nr:hypothetical protein BDV25DRAFT_165163 [Aspergillus avenaceus]